MEQNRLPSDFWFTFTESLSHVLWWYPWYKHNFYAPSNKSCPNGQFGFLCYPAVNDPISCLFPSTTPWNVYVCQISCSFINHKLCNVDTIPYLTVASRFYTLWKQRFCAVSLCICIKIFDWFDALVTLGCNYFVWGPHVLSPQSSRFASNHAGKTIERSHAKRVMKDISPRSLWKRINRTLKVTYLIRGGFRVMDGPSVIILILNVSTFLWFVSVTFRRLRFPGTDPAIYCFGSSDLARGG